MIAFIPGFLASLGLIVAIGAQNAFVIRQGLTKSHVLLVVVICAAADALLITLGIAGLGAAISGLPWLMQGARWFGVLYLTWFGIQSLRAAAKNSSIDVAGTQVVSRGKVIAAVLGFTFLNPHVYLDTLILLGSIGNQFGENRWFFALGASLASMTWFFGIGFGARAAAGVMSKPIFWRVLDTVIATVMFGIAAWLAFEGL
jgi:L-lysine exporter family protein LysE/ArgO